MRKGKGGKRAKKSKGIKGIKRIKGIKGWGGRMAILLPSRMCPEADGSAPSDPLWKVSRMIDVIADHRDAIRDLCRQYGVRRLDLIGSAATGAFDDATSDLDFIATFADTRVPGYADRYLNFAEALEALFARPVDVVIERSIRNPYFRQAVEASRQPIYDERNTTAAA